MTSSSLIGVLAASSSAMSLDTNTSPVRPVNRHRNLHSERGAHEPPRSHPVIKVPDLAWLPFDKPVIGRPMRTESGRSDTAQHFDHRGVVAAAEPGAPTSKVKLLGGGRERGRMAVLDGSVEKETHVLDCRGDRI